MDYQNNKSRVSQPFAGIVCCALALVISACGGSEGGDDVTVRGRITDGDGSQRALLGGSGTVAAATAVQASTIAPDGSLTLVGEAAVQAQGEYELTVPAEETRLIVQAVDESGEILASAVVEASGSAGGEVTATPMDTESSVEAEVLIALIGQGVAVAEANAVDVRARIDQSTAVAVRAAVASGSDAETLIAALAEAIAAAQQAEIQSYSQAGISTSQQALFAAELGASQTLSSTLDRGDPSAPAYDAFLTALAEVAADIGASQEAQANAEAAASLSLRLTLEGRLLGTDAAAEAVATAAIRAGARLEARASAALLDAILVAADAAAAVRTASASASSSLEAEVSAAASVEAVAAAYADYSAALIGEGTVTGSILGNHLEVDAAAAVAVDAAIDVTLTAAASFDASARAGVDAALQASTIADPQAIAAAVVEAWTTYHTAVETAVTTNAIGFGGDTDLGVTILVEATSHFHTASP